ncbi:MAG: hypothetical protein ACYCPT_13930 [Acidimicrobiales bacterium]
MSRRYDPHVITSVGFDASQEPRSHVRLVDPPPSQENVAEGKSDAPRSFFAPEPGERLHETQWRVSDYISQEIWDICESVAVAAGYTLVVKRDADGEIIVMEPWVNPTLTPLTLDWNESRQS